MKAIVINKADQSLSYTDVPNPVLKAGEVLIETYAAALNRADLLQREGNYPPPRNDGFGDNGGYDNYSRSARPVPPPAAPPMPDPGMSGDAGAEGGVDDIPF